MWRQPPPSRPPPCAVSARPMTATERWHQRDAQSKPAAGSPLGSGVPTQLPGRPTAPMAHANVTARPSRAPLRQRPEAAWRDVRPPPDAHRPWRAMLVGAHWSHYMEGGGEKVGEKDRGKIGGENGGGGEQGGRGSGRGGREQCDDEARAQARVDASVERAEMRCRMDELIRCA